MRSYQEYHLRCKKKISELLRQVFAEIDSESLEYSDDVSGKNRLDKKPEKLADAVKKEVKVYPETSEEFLVALKGISPDILNLMKRQLGAEAKGLFVGIMGSEDEGKKSAIESEEDFSYSDEVEYTD